MSQWINSCYMFTLIIVLFTLHNAFMYIELPPTINILIETYDTLSVQ